MALAVCLLFDSRSDRLVRELWERLEAEGVGTLASHTHRGHRPHLSVAVLRTWQLDDVQRVLADLPAPTGERMSCRGTLVFPRGRVALAPSVSAELMAHQQRVVGALEQHGADLHKHYRPGGWIPHISIATRAHATQLPLAIKALTDVFPLDVVGDRWALIDSSSGRLWQLREWNDNGP